MVAQVVKNPSANIGDVRDVGLILGSGGSPGGGNGNPLQYFAWKIPLTERSLVGYSLWGHKESDMTEQLSKHTHTQNNLILTTSPIFQMRLLRHKDINLVSQ